MGSRLASRVAKLSTLAQVVSIVYATILASVVVASMLAVWPQMPAAMSAVPFITLRPCVAVSMLGADHGG